MKIGYSVEGSTDRAVITGLRDRWCPGAVLEEGPFRGTMEASRRREYRKMFEGFMIKEVDVTILLSDGNGREWREVKEEELGQVPPERVDRVICGIPDRNIECWLCADTVWLANELHVDAHVFQVDDPKRAFEQAMEITRDDKKEERIADLVRRGPLGQWLENPSFEDFYERARDLSQVQGCAFENLRDTGD